MPATPRQARSSTAFRWTNASSQASQRQCDPIEKVGARSQDSGCSRCATSKELLSTGGAAWPSRRVAGRGGQPPEEVVLQLRAGEARSLLGSAGRARAHLLAVANGCASQLEPCSGRGSARRRLQAELRATAGARIGNLWQDLRLIEEAHGASRTSIAGTAGRLGLAEGLANLTAPLKRSTGRPAGVDARSQPCCPTGHRLLPVASAAAGDSPRPLLRRSRRCSLPMNPWPARSPPGGELLACCWPGHPVTSLLLWPQPP